MYKQNTPHAHMQKTGVKNPLTARSGAYCHFLFFVFILLFSVLNCSIVFAQNFTRTYNFADKHDHMIPLAAGVNGDEYVVAGTFADFDGGIRFAHMDPAGNVLQSYVYREPNHPKACFDFTKTPHSYFITCLRRDAIQDCIELIEVNEQGTILSDKLIIPSPGSADGFYPIHTMYYMSKLYICGYQTEGTGYPHGVDYTTQKKAFVLAYDPATQTVTSCFRLDTYNSTGSNPGSDYDMAVRMVPTNSGNIYVTGSCNIVRPLYNPALVPHGGYNEHEFTSGTMNMLVQPNLLSAFTTYNTPLAEPYSANNVGNYITQNVGECGYSMIEKNGVYFVAGNNYLADSATVPTSRNYEFTAVNPSNLNPMGTGSNSRWRYAAFDYIWGLQTLKSSTGDFTMAGMTSNLPPQCQGQIVTSDSNCNPFIANYNISFTGNSISLQRNYSRFYRSLLGTGKTSQVGNYAATQAWLYNNTWSCNLASVRLIGGTTNWTLTAPIWNPTTNKLNYKLIQGDNIGSVPTCPTSNTGCFSDVSNTTAVVVPLSSYVAQSQTPTINYQDRYLPYPTGVSNGYNDVNTYFPYSTIDCPVGPYYKLAETQPNVKTLVVVSLSPNPAYNTINVQLTGESKQVQLILLDIAGREVAKLYNGDANQLNQTKLLLPKLTTGLYFVHITANGNKLPVQKLMIEN